MGRSARSAPAATAPATSSTPGEPHEPRPRYLKTGRFDPERNPIAFQLEKAEVISEIDSNNEIINLTKTVDDLSRLTDTLIRAIAVLEDQISELRSRPADPADTLIHVDEKTNKQLIELSKKS